ncbi:MAG: hypothetical protein WC819_00955 [Parcubacteria group bacterium]
MTKKNVIQRVNYNEHPWALDEIVTLQGFMPEYLREDPFRIKENLEGERNINMLLTGADGTVLCYIFASPQNGRIVEDFADEVPCVDIDTNRYYIDQIVVKEGCRKGFLFADLLFATFREANFMGFFDFSAHALCSNRFDRIIERVLRDRLTKKIPTVLERYGGERYMYMEAHVDLLSSS